MDRAIILPNHFDHLITHISLTHETLILLERSKITDSEAQKDRTDKGRDSARCGLCNMHVVFVCCAVVYKFNMVVGFVMYDAHPNSPTHIPLPQIHARA